MSHVTATKTKIKDLDALEEVCNELGLELMRGQTKYKWFGRWVNDYSKADAAYRQGIDTKDYGKCEHAIRVKDNKNAYEMGLIANPEGEGYTLVWDFYGSQGKALQDVVGKDASKLRLKYNEKVVKLQMKKLQTKGFNLVNQQTKEGKVELVYRKT